MWCWIHEYGTSWYSWEKPSEDLFLKYLQGDIEVLIWMITKNLWQVSAISPSCPTLPHREMVKSEARRVLILMTIYGILIGLCLHSILPYSSIQRDEMGRPFPCLLLHVQNTHIHMCVWARTHIYTHTTPKLECLTLCVVRPSNIELNT